VVRCQVRNRWDTRLPVRTAILRRATAPAASPAANSAAANSAAAGPAAAGSAICGDHRPVQAAGPPCWERGLGLHRLVQLRQRHRRGKLRRASRELQQRRVLHLHRRAGAAAGVGRVLCSRRPARPRQRFFLLLVLRHWTGGRSVRRLLRRPRGEWRTVLWPQRPRRGDCEWRHCLEISELRVASPSPLARLEGMLGTGATRAAAVSAAISAAATRGAATAIRRDVLDGVHVFRSRVLPCRLQVPR